MENADLDVRNAMVNADHVKAIFGKHNHALEERNAFIYSLIMK